MPIRDASYFSRRGAPVRIGKYEYKSKIEAHWAVFFSELGIKFDYERSIFVPDSSKRDGGYAVRPDFWIPQLNLWCEVKPDEKFVDLDKDRANLFVQRSRERCAFLVGHPAMRSYEVFRPATDKLAAKIDPVYVTSLFGGSVAAIKRAIEQSLTDERILQARRPKRFSRPDTLGMVDERGVTVLDEVGPDEHNRWYRASRR